MTWNNIITAKKITQNNQEFLYGTFQIREILKFTKFTEHLVVDFDDVESDDLIYSDQRQIIPRYNSEIQRKVNNSKVEKIADFLINDPKAMFPTNIVISIPNQVIENYEENDKNITLTLDKTVNEEIIKENGNVYLTIIDGQHRIRGIERALERVRESINNISKVLKSSSINITTESNLEKQLEKNNALLNRLLSFELIVTFFIGISLEYQAMIFATINKTQTKVPENLVYSLFGITKNDSPQKTSLEVVLALNGIEKSPFFNRIKLVGGSYERGMLIPISQASMVKSILIHISNNPREAENDRFKDRRELRNNFNTKGNEFRKYYAENEDKKIIRILYSFFSAVRDCFVDDSGSSLWNLPSEGKISNILQTNVGYTSLLKVLFHILPNIQEEDRDKKEIYLSYLNKTKNINLLESGKYPFTSATINVLYNDLINLIENKY